MLAYIVRDETGFGAGGGIVIAPRVGVQLVLHGDLDVVRSEALAAEGLGLDHLWVTDHRSPMWGDEGAAAFECWTVLGALAVAVPSIPLGTLVACAAMRPPALLGLAAATVARLSRHPVTVGLGAGWSPADFLVGDDHSPAGRVRLLEDAATELAGQDGLEVLIAADGPATRAVAGRHAGAWTGSGPPEAWTRRSAAVTLSAEAAGRDPDRIRRVVNLAHPNEFEHCEAYLAAGATDFVVMRIDERSIENAARLRDHLARQSVAAP